MSALNPDGGCVMRWTRCTFQGVSRGTGVKYQCLRWTLSYIFGSLRFDCRYPVTALVGCELEIVGSRVEWTAWSVQTAATIFSHHQSLTRPATFWLPCSNLAHQHSLIRPSYSAKFIRKEAMSTTLITLQDGSDAAVPASQTGMLHLIVV